MFPNVCFFDIMNVYNHQARYANHLLARIYVFCNLFGHLLCQGVTPKPFVHKLLMPFVTLAAQRVRFPNLFFSTSSVLIMTIVVVERNFSSRICVFCTPFGYFV